MDGIIEQIKGSIGEFLPKLAGALLVLVLGWIIALLVSAIVRGILRRMSLDNKLANWVTPKAKRIDLEAFVAKIVFYTIMLFVVMGVFVSLGLTQMTEPINHLLIQVFEFLPRFIGAVILILVAWVIATVIKTILNGILDSTSLDDKLADKAGFKDGDSMSVSKNIAEIAFWLVFVLFLPAILGTLGTSGVLVPIQSMLNKFLSFLPNLISATVILIIGWFIARIVQKIVSNLLSAAGINNLSEKIGLSSALGKQKLSDVLGMVVYVFILIPIAVAALDALQLRSLTQPAANMLNTILGALPSIFSASVILIISYMIARMISALVTNALRGVGFDNLPRVLGFKVEAKEGQKTLSDIAGLFALIYIMIFAVLEACGQVGFDMLAGLLTEFIAFGSNVLLGALTIAIGLYVANLVANIIGNSGIQNSGFIATCARVIILILAGSMALHQIGIAGEIVNMTFGLLLGALCVAVALAFGLGCRDIAARELDGLITKLRSDSDKEAS